MSVHFSEGFQTAFDLLFGMEKEAGSGALATRMAIRAATKPTGLARKVVSSVPVPSLLERRMAGRAAKKAVQRQRISPGAIASSQATQAPGRASQALNSGFSWVKNNPGKAAVGGIGAAGGLAYLGTGASAQENPAGSQQYYSPYNY